MATIFTKFVPRTDQLPARVKAWTQTRGEAAYWPYTESLSKIGNHAAACDRLARKLKWQDQHFVGGAFGGGFAFVPCDVTNFHHHALTDADHVGANHTETTAEAARAAADTAFRDALTAAGIAQPFIDKLVAYAPAMLRHKYELGLLQFQSPATEAAFRAALDVWAASSTEEDHPLMTSYGTHS